jgi:hypothetical protein
MFYLPVEIKQNNRSSMNRKGFGNFVHSESPFGRFKSYDEEFEAFFSEKDPFGQMKIPKQYIEEFMKPFKFENLEQMVAEHFVSFN